MDGAVSPASIAICLSIGIPLLAGFYGTWVAIRSRDGAAITRDTTVSTFFGIALLLIVLNVIAATLIAVSGMAYFGLEKAVLLMTVVFAVAGMAVGLMRGLRSGSAIKTRSVNLPLATAESSFRIK